MITGDLVQSDLPKGPVNHWRSEAERRSQSASDSLAIWASLALLEGQWSITGAPGAPVMMEIGPVMMEIGPVISASDITGAPRAPVIHWRSAGERLVESASESLAIRGRAAL